MADLSEKEINDIIAQICGKVGTATPFNRGDSAEEKKRKEEAEEQLKKMSALTVGLDELKKAVDKITTLANSPRQKSSGSDFSNVTSAIS